MDSNKKNADSTDLPKIIGILGISTPKILFKLMPLLIKFKQQAKKGAQIFNQELVTQGVDQETAKRLTTIYLNGSDLTQLLRFNN